MSEAALAYIAKLMESMGIPYAFREWQEKPPDDYYFVGDYIEQPSMTQASPMPSASGKRNRPTAILSGSTSKNPAERRRNAASSLPPSFCGVSPVNPGCYWSRPRQKSKTLQ